MFPASRTPRSLPLSPLISRPVSPLALLAAVLLTGCGAGGEADEPPRDEPAVLPPAAVRPLDVDNGLRLPDDIDPVHFAYSEIEIANDLQQLTLGVLVADTFERRTRGLTHRHFLPRNTGMIFAFPADTSGPFWNKDSPMDLDLALVARDGTILEIRRLVGLDETLLTPTFAYRFALEMPAGWFRENGFNEADRLLIPPSIVAAEAVEE